MTIVFDMDNTLVDEFGATVRPGIVELLTRLKKEGHTLVLWTNSRRDRARQIILDHNLRRFFSAFVFREDYDPEEKGVRKDIRRVRGDVLVDDDPEEIRYMRQIGKKGVLVSSYRKGMKPDKSEIDGVYKNLGK